METTAAHFQSMSMNMGSQLSKAKYGPYGLDGKIVQLEVCKVDGIDVYVK